MALPDTVRKRIETEAAKRGADPGKAIAEAERLSSESESEEPSPDKKPAAESGSDFPAPFKSQLLIGHLPFVLVRELRNDWLGLTERIPDDGLTCAEFQRKYGGAPAPTTPEAA